VKPSLAQVQCRIEVGPSCQDPKTVTGCDRSQDTMETGHNGGKMNTMRFRDKGTWYRVRPEHKCVDISMSINSRVFSLFFGMLTSCHDLVT